MPAMTTAEVRTLMDIAVVKTGNLQNAAVAGRPETLFLVKDKHFKGKLGGVECDVYAVFNLSNLPLGVTPEGYFNAYIVDYLAGEVHQTVLGREADLCFTVTINGCTFSLGAPAPDGTLIVSHTNMKNTGSGTQDLLTATGGVAVPDVLKPMVQENVQARIAKQLHGSGVMLGPSQYYNPTRTNHLTVFGMRGGAWSFHYLSYRYVAREFTHEGVHDFAARAIVM